MDDDSIDFEFEELLRESNKLNKSGAFVLNDPLLPISKYLGKKKLDVFERRFNNGDKLNLLHALSTCLTHELTMPDWVKKSFIEAHKKIVTLEVNKLEDVFGSTKQKGKHAAAIRKKMKLSKLVFFEVGVAVRDGKAVDIALFEEIGNKLGLGKTLVSEYYYEELEFYGAPPLAYSDETSAALIKSLFGSSAKS